MPAALVRVDDLRDALSALRAMLSDMETNYDALKAMLPSLRDRHSTPPRDALLTLVALAGEAPEQVVALQLARNCWQIVALHGSAISVVTADPGADTHWSLEHDRRPDGATVLGRCHPIRSVDSIEVRNARIFQRGWIDSGLDIAGQFEYVIHLSDGAAIEFPRDPTDREHATTNFVRELQARL